MRALAACTLAALLAAGCSGSKHRLTVYAASSLTDAFQRLASGARFDFAGSNTLAAQFSWWAAILEKRLKTSLLSDAFIE